MEKIQQEKLLRAKILRVYADGDLTYDQLARTKDAIQPFMVGTSLREKHIKFL